MAQDLPKICLLPAPCLASALAALAALAITLAPNTTVRADGAPEAASTTWSSGPLVIGSRILDLGRVVRGNTARGEVSVRNVGASPMRLVSHSPAELSIVAVPPIIQPGGEARIGVSLPTTEIADADKFGSVARVLKLQFLCGEEPFGADLPVRVQLETLFEPTPPRLTPGPLTVGGAPAEATLLIEPAGAEDLTITGVDLPPGARVASIESLFSMGRSSKRLHLVIDPPARVGPYEGEIAVHIDSARLPILRVPIDAVVCTDLRLSPAEIDLGHMVRGSEVAPTVVEIRTGGPRPLKVCDIAAGSPALRARLLPPTAPGLARVEVSIDDAAPAGAIVGSIEVHVNRPEAPVVTIPVRGELVEPVRLCPPGAFIDTERAPQAEIEVQGVALDPAAMAVETDLSFLVARIESRGGKLWIVIGARPGASAPETFAGWVELRTGIGAQPSVRARVDGTGGATARR